MSSKTKDARRKTSRAMTGGKKDSSVATKKRKAIQTTKRRKTASASPDPLAQLGELPRSHGTDSIFLIARDPHRLYCYWDIDISRHPGGPTYLRSYVGSAESPESELPVTFESRNHELPARQAGSRYTVELGYLRGTTWHLLARSATAETPPDRMATVPGTVFTTVSPSGDNPSAPHSHESPDIPSARSLAELPLQHRRILEMLLGENLFSELSSASFSSEELSSRIHQHLEELLSSRSASELLARIPGALAAISGQAGHSANFPSLTPLQLARWTRETLSSFAPVRSWSSWLSWLSSELETSAFLPSAPGGGASLPFLSSVLGGSEMNLSSLGGFSSESGFSSPGGLSSPSGDLSSPSSSWHYFPETLSSPGNHDELELSLQTGLLIAGHTRPDTRLSIDGQPVPVSPQGSFQHRVFPPPGGPREVTLVATSSDGTRSRRTTLRIDCRTDWVATAPPR